MAVRVCPESLELSKRFFGDLARKGKQSKAKLSSDAAHVINDQ